MSVNRYYSSTAVDSTLSGSITNVATSMTVASVSGWPTSYPYTVILDEGTASEELVQVTAGAGTTLTIQRGIDGTTGVSHANGATARHGVSAQDFREPQQHMAATSGVHGVSGNVVGTSDAQTIINKDLTSTTNAFPISLVTLTGSQSLSSKNLSDPTNIFPATLATLSGTQTLLNKTLTAPVMSDAVINQSASGTNGLIVKAGAANPSANIMEIQGNTGTPFIKATINAFSIGVLEVDGQLLVPVAGINVTAGFNNTIPLGIVANAAQSVNLTEWRDSSNNLLTSVDSAGRLVNKIPAQSVQITANVGGIQGTEVTVATASAITGDGSTRVEIRFDYFGWSCNTAGETYELRIKDGATQVHAIRFVPQKVSSTEGGGSMGVVLTPSAGAHTYSVVAVRTAGSGTGILAAAATAPATLIVRQLV